MKTENNMTPDAKRADSSSDVGDDWFREYMDRRCPGISGVIAAAMRELYLATRAQSQAREASLASHLRNAVDHIQFLGNSCRGFVAAEDSADVIFECERALGLAPAKGGAREGVAHAYRTAGTSACASGLSTDAPYSARSYLSTRRGLSPKSRTLATVLAALTICASTLARTASSAAW